MNTSNIKLHDYQLLILKKLATSTCARFNDLLIEGLESEHMNYHLQKLISLDFVTKDDAKYALTDTGKDFSSMLDDNVETVEKQPKTSVLLDVKRINPDTNKCEYLVSKRLRQPYFGKAGKLTGKVRFGETLKEAAERELYEETGLSAKVFKLKSIYHKLRYKETDVCKDYVQDVIFYTFLVTDVYGSMIKVTPYQENIWITQDDITLRKNLDFFEDFSLDPSFETGELKLEESVAPAVGF